MNTNCHRYFSDSNFSDICFSSVNSYRSSQENNPIFHQESSDIVLLSGNWSDSCVLDNSYKCDTTLPVSQGNMALHESQMINQLCTCKDDTLKWCFIHTRVTDPPELVASVNKFGFIPTCAIEYPLFRPSYDLEADDLQQWAFQAHLMVRSTGVFNYKKARIRVPTELQADHWRALCNNYQDQKILEYLEYGFPLCMDRSRFEFNATCENHPSATQYPSDVDAYFRKEVKHQAIVGPCTSIPFPVHFSPLLTRHKPDDTRRVIVNLSHPQGRSVNDCINDGIYDDVTFTLKYPTVDQIVQTPWVCIGMVTLFWTSVYPWG